MGKPIVSNKAGTIAANGQTVVIDTSQANSAAILLSGTYNLTLVFEVSDDNATTWFPATDTTNAVAGVQVLVTYI